MLDILVSLISFLLFISAVASVICWLIILIDAFSEGVIEGIFCLIVPFYICYFAFAKFDHGRKGLILVLCFAPAGFYILMLLLGLLLGAAAIATM